MAVDGSLNFDTKIDTSGFKNGTNSIKTQANALKGTLASLGKTIGVVFGVAQLTKFGKQAVKFASDLQEVQNVVDTAFGSMAYKMEKFADTSIESFGISKLAAKQTGSIFMAMGAGMGLAGDNASDMAVALTGLSADMSSFYNVTQDVASTALKSIYTGETETLKQFGVVMTEANLQNYALSKGIKTTVENMTQAEKVQLRYNFTMEQLALAQGDFAKTSGSWANQVRVMGEKWKELLGILGSGLIQVLTPVVRFISTGLSYLIEYATKVGQILSTVLGINNAIGETGSNSNKLVAGTADAATGLTEMGDAAKEANKKASGTAGFDKLNNLTENVAGNAEDAASAITDMGGIDQASTATIKVESDTSAMDAGLAKALEYIKSSLSTFSSYIKDSFAPTFSKIWTDLQKPINDFKAIFSTVFSDMQTLVQPFIDYFTESYVPYLKQAFTTLGTIVTGLFDTFNKVFSDIWNIAVFPMAQKFITVILPMLTDFGTQVWTTLQTIFTSVKTIFDMIWTDAIAPALEVATQIWMDFVDILAAFWNKWGAPIFENIRKAWQTTTDLFVSLWKSYLKPIWDKWMQVIDKLWEDHLKPLLANFMDFVGELVNGALEIYNKFIAPILKWFIEKLGPPIAKVITGLIDKFGEFFGNIIDAVSGVITALKGIVQFITGVFSGDWSKAWEGIKTIFKGVFDALVGIVKTPINLIIDLINGMIKGIVTGINSVIGALNSLSIDIPKTPWTDAFTLGFNLKEFTAPKIPKLATGTVVPANYGEFLAKLGDNKREPEVVSPVSTMKQAFKEAMTEMSGSGKGDITLNVYLSGKQIHTEIVKQDKEYKAQTGKSAFSY